MAFLLELQHPEAGSSSGTFDFPSRGHSEGRLGHARALGRLGFFGSPSCPVGGWTQFCCTYPKSKGLYGGFCPAALQCHGWWSEPRAISQTAKVGWSRTSTHRRLGRCCSSSRTSFRPIWWHYRGSRGGRRGVRSFGGSTGGNFNGATLGVSDVDSSATRRPEAAEQRSSQRLAGFCRRSSKISIGEGDCRPPTTGGTFPEAARPCGSDYQGETCNGQKEDLTKRPFARRPLAALCRGSSSRKPSNLDLCGFHCSEDVGACRTPRTCSASCFGGPARCFRGAGNIRWRGLETGPSVDRLGRATLSDHRIAQSPPNRSSCSRPALRSEMAGNPFSLPPGLGHHPGEGASKYGRPAKASNPEILPDPKPKPKWKPKKRGQQNQDDQTEG